MYLISFILALIPMIVVLWMVYPTKQEKPKNRGHFYVAREADGALRLFMGKPIRCEGIFVSCREKGGRCLWRDGDLEMYGLNENDYKDLKWEDEPLEVFVTMED